jgi:hypothetical protein
MKELQDLGRAPRDLLGEGHEQEIFVLSLSDLVKGRGLNSAKSVAWQLLLDSASGLPVAAVVGHPHPGKTPRLTSLGRGPLIAKSLEATAEVEALPEVQDHEYELRRLGIAGLNIRAFWLKSLDGAGDLIVPYHAVTNAFKRMQPYREDEFIPVIRRLAQKRLKFDDRPQYKTKK